MANINSVIIGGNLVRDPELRVTPKGTSIAQFTIGNNRKWRDDTGTDREDVAFIDCEAWGKTGDTIAKYFTKGRAIIVEGRLKQDQWDDKATGQKRSRVKVSVSAFHFVGGRQDGDAASRRNEDTPAPAGARALNPSEDADQDVPF